MVPPKITKPGRGGQAIRLDPKFLRLRQAMAARRAELQEHSQGLTPEKALVFDTISSVSNFVNAVGKVPGLEWLLDLDIGLKPDEDFFLTKKPTKGLNGHLYLLMSDERALKQVLSLWKQFKRGKKLERGFGAWTKVFENLHDVRTWSAEDRLRDTGIVEVWHDRVAFAEETGTADPVRFEIEPWFRQNPTLRRSARSQLRKLITACGGRVLDEHVIEGIAYHGLLVEIPIQAAEELLRNPYARLLHAEEVAHFRPQAQAVAGRQPVEDEEPLSQSRIPLQLDEAVEPIIAVLDGLPLERHVLLDGGLRVDDPEELAGIYEAQARMHGTSICSAILRGDLEADEEPLDRPIYVRPVLRPFQALDGWDEASPDDRLFIDVIHRAVRRAVEGEGDFAPTAPEVRVFNMSLGDRQRLFDGGAISPWARLLDWLSHKLNVLFIVSAGNHLDEIKVPDSNRTQLTQSPELRERRVLKVLVDENRLRRLRVPAEAINALTVGASHRDASSGQPGDDRMRIDLLQSNDLPSPVSAQGGGYRRAIKPDILAPGGRLLFVDRVSEGDVVFQKARTPHIRPPGVRCAFPGLRGGLAHERFTHGTSIATALVTHGAARLHSVLDQLRSEPGGDGLDPQFDAVLLKALLVHGAEWWRTGADALSRALGLRGKRDQRRFSARFLGYGHLDVERVVSCTQRRATLLGFGVLAKEEGHVFEVPIPFDLSGASGLRRLVITLAWLSPINPSRQQYRQAALWIQTPGDQGVDDPLGVSRMGADHNAVQRGTVQHEVLEGKAAAIFDEGDKLLIPVNCREDADMLSEGVRYGLAVTLEIGEDLGIDIDLYEAVRAAIRPQVRPRPR